MIGQTLGHYRIESTLGEGGMGIVYKAHDTHLERAVAVKVLHPDRVADAERKRRFVQEAKSASALNHPNILHIYDIDASAGVDFMAMEYVAGKTLGELIHPKGLKWNETLKYAVQIADALAAAHAAGIIHRDVKPSNVMVTEKGVVKVLDFGLAKLSDIEASDASATTRTIHPATEEGMIVGTLAYMSPEQAEGRKLDARSDIFSFGSVLYEMISGRRAFQGESKLSTLSAIVHKDPAPLPAVTPPDLEKVILRCLRKDPARRYQTMGDLKIALEDLYEESSSGKRVRPAPLNRRYVWAAGLLTILAVAALVAWRYLRPPQNAEPLRATVLTTFPGLQYHPALSPDGNHLAFSWNGPKQENKDLYVQMIGSGSPLRLTTDPLEDYNPVWSPDGRWIAFFRGSPPAPTGYRARELRLIPPLGGSDRKLAEIRSQDFPFAVFLAWSADSKSLFVTDTQGEGKPDALFVVSVDTGEKRPLTRPQSPILADTSPAVSPDGRSLVFLRRTSWGSGELHLLPLKDGPIASGEPRRLTPATLRADHPVWTPDGKEIVFSAKGNLWRLAANGAGAPTVIPYVGDAGIMPTISRPEPGKPARLAYVRSFTDFNFWRVETSSPGAPSSSPPVLAIASTKPEYHCRFSPDGRRVAFSTGRSGEQDIWISDPDGANSVQLTSMDAQETMCPYWSPDGRTIAFSSNPEGEFAIYSVPVAGGKPRRLTTHASLNICPAYSRDGKSLYFSSMRSGDYRIWKMPAEGGDAVMVSPTQGGGGAIESWDGQSLYYNSVAVVGEVFRMPLTGGAPVKVIDGMIWFNYSVTEKGIYYIDRQGTETRLQYLNFATAKPTTVAKNLGEVGAGLAAAPDGKTILFTRMDSSADDLMLVENFH